MWEAIFFYSFATAAVASALLMVLMKNPVVSAVYLVVTFFCLAAFFVMLNAQLLAALEVIIYAGAIMVLFLFVIMLLNLNRTSFTSYKLFFTKLFAVGIMVIVLFIIGGALGGATEWERPPQLQVDDNYAFDPKPSEHVQTFAKILFTRYVYPFEIIAIMLLAAVIGAVLITRKEA